MAPKLYAHQVVDLAQRFLFTKSLDSAALLHLLSELDFVEPSFAGPSRIMRELPSSLTMRIDLGKAQQFKPKFFWNIISIVLGQATSRDTKKGRILMCL